MAVTTQTVRSPAARPTTSPTRRKYPRWVLSSGGNVERFSLSSLASANEALIRLDWSFAASAPSSPHLTAVRTSRSSSKGTSTGRTPRRSSAFQTTPSGTRRPTRNIRSTGLSRRHSSQRDDLGETPRLKLCELREHLNETTLSPGDRKSTRL